MALDSFRQWAVAVCVAAVVCTVLGQFFPENALGQQGRRLLPCVFLCVMLAPLLTARWALPSSAAEPSADASAALEVQMRRQLVEQTNATLLSMVNQALASYGLSAEKVATDMDIDGEGRINIGQIVVYVNEETARRSLQVQQVAEARLGMAVTVARMEVRGP